MTSFLLVVIAVLIIILAHATKNSKSSYDKGYDWAKHEKEVLGTSDDVIWSFIDGAIDRTDFDYGARNYMLESIMTSKKCLACDGSGKIKADYSDLRLYGLVYDTCNVCNGTGEVQ